jgi:uracil-DNA glycosylase family 4
MTYEALVEKRKNCRLCVKQDPGEIYNCARGPGPILSWPDDFNAVSHWSQFMGHRSPEIVVVGQDYSDWESFYKYEGDDCFADTTNKNLSGLLGKAKIYVDGANCSNNEAKVYLTNSILCLKRPPMARSIRRRWVSTCASEFLRPLLCVLKPKVVVGMGNCGWTAVCKALDLPLPNCGILKLAGTTIPVPAQNMWAAAVAHCSNLGFRNRERSKQEKDWENIGRLLTANPNLRRI